MESGTDITKDMLIDDLIKIGLKQGDLVYVHTSMKRIGWIDGGAETLLEAFLEVLGPTGTLALPAHSYTMAKPGQQPYHPNRTPSCVGKFPEFVRQYPGAFRSGHPTHSTVAVGAKAKEITQNHNIYHWQMLRQCQNGKFFRHLEKRKAV